MSDEKTYEYVIEWGYDQHTHGGYGPVANTPEEAISSFEEYAGRPADLRWWMDDLLRREVGTEKWQSFSL